METTAEKKAHFLSLLKKCDTGMLVSHNREGEPHARPMAVAQVDDDGDLWVATGIHSGKVVELEKDSRASFTVQQGPTYLSVSGHVNVVQDMAMVQRLWKEQWKVWFPKGPTDPNIALLHIKTQRGEFWDNSGATGIVFLYEAAKAYLSGERARPPKDAQGKVNLRD